MREKERKYEKNKRSFNSSCQAAAVVEVFFSLLSFCWLFSPFFGDG